MKKRLYVKIFLMVILLILLSPSTFGFAYEPLKIYYNNKEITKKIYPAYKNGKVYVIDKNFLEILFFKDYTIYPLFTKNEQNIWYQYAIKYQSKGSFAYSSLESVRIYSNSTLVRHSDQYGYKDYNMNSPIISGKSKEGDIYLVSKEEEWTSNNNEQAYTPEQSKRIIGTYNLHFIPLRDFCAIWGKQVMYDKLNNTITIY